MKAVHFSLLGACLLTASAVSYYAAKEIKKPGTLQTIVSDKHNEIFSYMKFNEQSKAVQDNASAALQTIAKLSAAVLPVNAAAAINSASGVIAKQLQHSIKEKAAAATIEYGIMCPKYDSDAGIKSADNLGLGLYRMTVRVDQPTELAGYEKFYDAGLNVFPVFNWGAVNNGGGQKPREFPQNLTLYRSNLNKIFNTMKTNNELPDMVAIENEPTNELYYIIRNNDMSDYINELEVAIEVCHSFGVKVCDGALHPQGLMYLTWKNYDDKGMNDSADYVYDFLSNAAKNYIRDPKANDFDVYMDKVNQLIAAYTTMDLDYVNYHFFDPVSFDGTQMADHRGMVHHYNEITGKPVVTNAWAINSTSESYLSTVMNNIKDAGVQFAVYYNANDKNSKALTNSNGTLTALGSSFKNILKIIFPFPFFS